MLGVFAGQFSQAGQIFDFSSRITGKWGSCLRGNDDIVAYRDEPIYEWSSNMVSLQEQLLKAGLVDKNKVKKVNQDKSKQKKIERRTGTESVNEAREAALELQRKNAERARELNAQRDAAAQQKAIMAQIADMVHKNKQSKGKGDIAYNFTHGTRIERMYVSAAVQAHLMAGRLVIVCLGGATELVPRVIAD
jgi:uncharacterized protein YaiL (DUF2058 family)